MVNEVIEPEKEAAIRKIRRLMDFWRISPHELRSRGGAAPAPRRVKAAVEQTTRYRHPISGATWDGAGPQPTWLREALLFEGYTVDQLRVHPHKADNDAASGSCA